MNDAPDPAAEPAPDGPGESSGAPEVVPAADEPHEDDVRRYPSTIGGACYLAALATTAAGLAVVTWGDWRIGIQVMAAALVGAAGCRAVLPARDAGMLAVRHRLFDAGLLGLVGVLLVVLARTIPDQPPL